MPGDEYLLVTLAATRIGVQICFDTESFRSRRGAMALGGAELLVTASANMAPYGLEHRLAPRRARSRTARRTCTSTAAGRESASSSSATAPPSTRAAATSGGSAASRSSPSSTCRSAPSPPERRLPASPHAAPPAPRPATRARLWSTRGDHPAEPAAAHPRDDLRSTTGQRDTRRRATTNHTRRQIQHPAPDPAPRLKARPPADHTRRQSQHPAPDPAPRLKARGRIWRGWDLLRVDGYFPERATEHQTAQAARAGVRGKDRAPARRAGRRDRVWQLRDDGLGADEIESLVEARILRDAPGRVLTTRRAALDDDGRRWGALMSGGPTARLAGLSALHLFGIAEVARRDTHIVVEGGSRRRTSAS